MPKALEPNRDFPVVLESDMDKPAATRPTFWVKSMSMRQQLDFAEQIDAANDYDNTKELFDRNCELIESKIVRWDNMGGFVLGECDLRDVLSYNEARELLRKIQANAHVSIEEKKS